MKKHAVFYVFTNIFEICFMSAINLSHLSEEEKLIPEINLEMETNNNGTNLNLVL